MAHEENRVPCPADSRGLCAPPYCDGYRPQASRPGWTPTTGEVRDWWMQGTAEDVSAFDRWLAEHDREVAAQALRGAAEWIDADDQFAADYFSDEIRARADRIAAGEQP